MKVASLRKRAHFLKVQGSRHRFSRPAFLLTCLPLDILGQDVAVGYTVTKKIGNAVVRNRTKRRLRAVATPMLQESATPGHAYVWIARAPILDMPHETLVSEMRWALRKIEEMLNKAKAKTEAAP